MELGDAYGDGNLVEHLLTGHILNLAAANGPANLVGNRVSTAQVRIQQNNSELLAAEAGHEILALDAPFKGGGYEAQHLITD